MMTFSAIELGRAVRLPDDVALRVECDWVTDGSAKKGAFTANFTLSETEVASALFGGTVSAVEKRFSVYGRLSASGASWLGLLQCVSYGGGAYTCAFVERAKDIWDEKVYRLATLPPYTSYNDIFTDYSRRQEMSLHWHQPLGVNYERCAIDYALQPGCCLPRVRLDLVVDVVNSMQGLHVPVMDWMRTQWLYCVRSKVYAPDVVEGVDFDWEAVEEGTQYPVLWNLPEVSLYELLSRLALLAGYGTYVDGDTVSFVEYTAFKPSGALNVGQSYIEGQSAEYGVLPFTEGRIVTANGTELATIMAERANGVAAGVGDIMEVSVYWSTSQSAYVVKAEDGETWAFSDELDKDAVVLTPQTSTAPFAPVKAFLQMVARVPKKVKYTLFGDGFPIYRPQYVPQLDVVCLPLSMTSQGGETAVEGVVLADYEPNELADYEYVFELSEGEGGDTGPSLSVTLGEPGAVTCGTRYPLIVRSEGEDGFIPYTVAIEWQNATVNSEWLGFMMSVEDAEGAEVSADGNTYTVTAQAGAYALMVTPPLYAAIRIRVEQQGTGLTDLAIPPFNETPITDYAFNFVGVAFQEPAYNDLGGAPTFTIKYESRAAGGCVPLPCDVEFYALGCNVNNSFTQSYDPSTGQWVVTSKAVWPSPNSYNEIPSWDYPRTHHWGSYSPGIRFRLRRDGTELRDWQSYYATSLYAGGRRAMGYWEVGALKPASPGYRHQSDGRWLIWDGARDEWQQVAEGGTFNPAPATTLTTPPTFIPGKGMTRLGRWARVALNVVAARGKCYAQGAQSGATGPWVYLLWLDWEGFPLELYNGFDRPIPRSHLTSVTVQTMANNWQSRWRMRLNSTATSLEACNEYPTSDRCQGEGFVTAEVSGAVQAYPVIVVDLSTGYVPAGSVWEIPFTVQLNNATP